MYWINNHSLTTFPLYSFAKHISTHVWLQSMFWHQIGTAHFMFCLGSASLVSFTGSEELYNGNIPGTIYTCMFITRISMYWINNHSLTTFPLYSFAKHIRTHVWLQLMFWHRIGTAHFMFCLGSASLVSFTGSEELYNGNISGTIYTCMFITRISMYWINNHSLTTFPLYSFAKHISTHVWLQSMFWHRIGTAHFMFCLGSASLVSFTGSKELRLCEQARVNADKWCQFSVHFLVKYEKDKTGCKGWSVLLIYGRYRAY